MRIDPQIQQSDPAKRAPDLARADLLAGFGGLFSVLATVGETARPEGISQAASREMTDPLGLATAEAAVSAGGPGAVATDAEARATKHQTKAPQTAQQQATGERSGAQGSPAGSGVDTARSGSDAQTKVDSQTQTTEARDPAHAGTKASAATTQGGASPAAPAQAGGPPAGSSARGVRAVGAVGATQATSGTATAAPSGNTSTGIGAVPGGLAGGASKFSALMKQNPAPQTQHLRDEAQQAAPQVASQVSKGLASLVLKEGGTAQIHLRPEALGRVDVELTVRDGVVNATMSAENETARDLLGSELDRLRALLEQRGLRVERLEISPGPDGLDAQKEPGEGRGGRWIPAQDAPQGFGTDADGRSSWNGDRQRAWGGGPEGRAERGGPGDGAGTAEPGVARYGDGDGAGDRRRPTVLSVRLDTVA